jgi:hypothetical protein
VAENVEGRKGAFPDHRDGNPKMAQASARRDRENATDKREKGGAVRRSGPKRQGMAQRDEGIRPASLWEGTPSISETDSSAVVPTGRICAPGEHSLRSPA